MDNAFEKARAAYGTGAYDDATLEFLFPQLKESEDEKIVNWLIRLINTGRYRELESDPMPCLRGKLVAYLEKQKEQKPAWSEEDEKKLTTVISLMKTNRAVDPFYDKMCLESWLKSLRPQPPVEWTEEDRRMLRACIEAVGSMSIRGDVQDLRDWLKSLCPECCNRPKPAGSWRPSEEQMEALKHYVDTTTDGEIDLLYNDLKKLI